MSMALDQSAAAVTKGARAGGTCCQWFPSQKQALTIPSRTPFSLLSIASFLQHLTWYYRKTSNISLKPPHSPTVGKYYAGSVTKPLLRMLLLISQEVYARLHTSVAQ